MVLSVTMLEPEFAQYRSRRGGPNPVRVSNQTVNLPAPQTGLAGAEASLFAGGQAATDAILQGMNQARGDILAGERNATGQLQGARNLIGSATNRGVAGLQGAQNQLRRDISQSQRLLSGGASDLSRNANIAQGTLNSRFNQAVDPLTGFQSTGEQANQLQAALTGALGPQAQAEAIANFQRSPGQDFLLEEAERATLRNAAAIGGLGGGNVRRELQRQAIGIANQNFNDRIAQLAGISGQGLQAAGQIGQLRANQGTTSAGISQQLGRDLSNIRGDQAQLQAQAGLSGINTAGNVANLLSGGAGQQAQLAQNAAEIERATGLSLADLSNRTGLSVADIVSNIGQTSAGLRTQAGRDLANAIQGTTSGVSALQSQQGAGLADIVGQGGSQISNLLLQQGLADADAQRQLGTLLANIGVEGATNQASIAQSVGDIQAAGILGKNAVVADAITKLGADLGNSGILDGIFRKRPVGVGLGSR